MIKNCWNTLMLKMPHFTQLIILFTLFSVALTGCIQDKTDTNRDTEKEKGILLLEKVSSTQNLSEQIIFANDALDYSAKNEIDSLQYECIFKLGILYLMKGEIDSSQFYLEQSKLGFKKLNYSNRVLSANGALIRLHRFLDDREAVSRLIVASDRIIAIENNPTEDYIFYYIQKLGFYYTLGLQDSTLALANYADSVATSIHSVKYSPQLKSVKGVVYAYLGNDTLAVQNYKATLSEYHPYERDMAIMLTNIGNAYARLNEVDSALHYFERAQEVYEKSDVNETVLNTFRMDIAYALSSVDAAKSKPYFNLVDLNLLPPKNKFYYYYAQREYTTSLQEKIKLTQNALTYLKTLDLYAKDLEVSCYHDLYTYYSQAGDFQNALIQYEQYNTLNEQLKSEEIAQQMQTLDLLKHVKQKDEQILNQELLISKKNELISAQAYRLYLTIASTILLLIVFFMFVNNYKRKGKINQLKLKQKQLEQQLLIKEMDPISSQLGSASETIELAKLKLSKINQQENQNEINEIKIILNQWLSNFNDKESTVNAQKLIESDFLDKLNQYPNLTESEKNIVILIKQGYKTKEISERLNLAQNTVEIYRSRIRKKLNATQNEQLSDKITNI